MMTTEPLKESGLSQVKALEDLCFPDPWSLSGLRGVFTDSRGLLLAAKAEDGEICGYINCDFFEDELNINRICTGPAHRRKGVGTALLEALFAFCAGKGIQKIFLEVRASNAGAIALYQKMGFSPVGRRPRFYDNPVEDALLMRKDLPAGETIQKEN